MSTAEASTDVRDGYSATYTLDIRDIEVHGEAIVLNVNDDTLVITVSSNDGTEVVDLADRIRESLSRSL